MLMLLSLVLLVLCGFRAYPRFRQRAAVKQWYKTLNLRQHEDRYHELFKHVDGFSLSRQARVAYDAIEYTYGEIEFPSFIALLSLAKPDSKTIFYDLGSGTGRAVFACAMVFGVQKSCGIELLSPLSLSALKQQQHLQQWHDYSEQSQALYFINADFLTVDFTDATLIFINATAFFGDTWDAIHQALKQVKAGTTIITTSKKLNSNGFMIIRKTWVAMSWGPVSAYIHQRI